MKSIKVISYLLISIYLVPSSIYADELRVSIQLQPKQRDKFELFLHRFFLETGIKVKSMVDSDMGYKLKVPVWLEEGKDTPDVMFWSASQRLYRYAEMGLLMPITDLWDEEQYDEQFKLMKHGVSYQGEVYAVPFAHYHWGLYYRKSMVKNFGGLPEDWESFLALLARMKEAGITPLGIGTKQNWPAAAWFDYIDLRTNGLQFHLDLLGGKISFHHPRVQSVLSDWKRLIDNKYYNRDHMSHRWDGLLPLFYRNQIGFLLLGSFVASRWPDNQELYDDIGFLPFPKMQDDFPYFENAPTDIFVIPKNTKQEKEAKAFIKFIARPDVQTALNHDLGYLPPNSKSTVGNDRFVQAGSQMFQRAEGLAQFFDRDAPPDFEKLATPLLADFITTGDIQSLTIELEKARLEVFGPLQ
ncbi:ABC transporter substrate-binding protein [Alteromonas flava]|uniref:ABC transporter substrate-binding protein n=1 Tax=Alteromonas flava TaxID=2048003 RepID=UPI000C28E6E3|nr:ABC transporter substrate-binding protein [Alteromonas flava]